VLEVSIAVVLLVGAGLLQRTFSNLMNVDLGFQPAGVVTASLFLGVRPPEVRAAVLDRILDQVDAVPGVQSVGAVQFLPLRGMTCGTAFWNEAEATGRDPARAHPTDCALVTRDYVAAMGIPVLEGRAFDRRDRLGSARVVMVNDAFARRYFGGGPAIGRRVLVDSSNQAPAEVIAVVGNVRHEAMTSAPSPCVFLLHAQTPGYITNLVVRTAGEGQGIAPAIKRAVHDVDPAMAVSGMGTLEQDVSAVLAPTRVRARLVAAIAVLAVALAVIGLYGLLAYIVEQRAHEIGIRLALGATRHAIFGAVLAEGARLVVLGLVCGLVAALGLRRVIATFVFAVTAGDPATYLGAVAGFTVIALAVLAVPALRAARLTPMAALRDE
jgi:predicted permease